MLGLALWGLQPIKTRAGYIVAVDGPQGAMQAPTVLLEGRLQDRSVLIEAFLAQYVVARESVDPERLRRQYRKVMLWSDPAVAGRYRSDLSRRIDGSPPPDVSFDGERRDAATAGARVQVTIQSVSLLSSGTALVRYQATRQDQGGGGVAEDWTASLAFSFTRAPLTLEDRLVNPLGFQVTAYQAMKDRDLDPQSTPGRF
jgi:type IV secretion system protein VirB8